MWQANQRPHHLSLVPPRCTLLVRLPRDQPWPPYCRKPKSRKSHKFWPFRLFLSPRALWSPHNVFGPPTMVAAVVDFQDQSFLALTAIWNIMFLQRASVFIILYFGICVCISICICIFAQSPTRGTSRSPSGRSHLHRMLGTQLIYNSSTPDIQGSWEKLQISTQFLQMLMKEKTQKQLATVQVYNDRN